MKWLVYFILQRIPKKSILFLTITSRMWAKLLLVWRLCISVPIVGREYLFLFAADCDPDEHLVNYYSQKLKFKKADEHSAAMPIYDFTCKFMYQGNCGIRREANEVL